MYVDNQLIWGKISSNYLNAYSDGSSKADGYSSLEKDQLRNEEYLLRGKKNICSEERRISAQRKEECLFGGNMRMYSSISWRNKLN